MIWHVHWRWSKNVLDFFNQIDYIINMNNGDKMKIGDLVRIKMKNSDFTDKLAIIVVNGTWSVDVHIIENGRTPRIAKEHCEVINENR